MTVLEAKQTLARKLNIDYTKIAQNGLFSDADLLDAIQAGNLAAWMYRRWEFTLEALKFDVTGDDMTRGYVGYPNTFEDKSIYLLTVEDEEWRKKKFPDFKLFFSDNPTATDTYWTEFQRKVFLNMNALSAGDEVCLYGKLRAPVLDEDADLLPFSPENDNDETSGNRAIVMLAYADILASGKKNKPTEAEAETKKAYRLLDQLWDPMDERESVEQHVNRPFFSDVPDFFAGGNGRGTQIGSFE